MGKDLFTDEYESVKCIPNLTNLEKTEHHDNLSYVDKLYQLILAI